MGRIIDMLTNFQTSNVRFHQICQDCHATGENLLSKLNLGIVFGDFETARQHKINRY